MSHLSRLALAMLLAAQAAAGLAGDIAAPMVERVDPTRLTVNWTDTDPVDVYVSDKADATMASSRLISAADRDGSAEVKTGAIERPYILLHDRKSGQVVRVAERLLPLDQGSNFRDVGGYPAAGGKHVRWGMIYRSGGTPLLSDTDLQRVDALGLKDMVDLRSSEERVIAPTRIDGVRYAAVGYSMAKISGGGTITNGGAIYRNFPTLLAPQLRVVFDKLLQREGPIAYNCSAGQDRTGFATAMILSALGVPRDTILADYHLSTTYRRPQYEMPKIDTVAQANNPVALYFAQYQKDPKAAAPKPLYDANHKAFLTDAFEEIEKRWGSVDAYLDKELGVGAADIAKLRAAYLE